MLWIAVCDDVVLECCELAGRIGKILEESKIPCVVRQFYSGRELLKSLENFDILFLDILMKGLDGMKTAELFRRRAADKILIFVSASRKFVFDAYEVEAFQYLVKPVGDQKLRQVLKRALLKTEKNPREFLVISREREKSKVFLDDIFYFEIHTRVVYIHGREGVLAYYEKIGALEEQLRDKEFFRCHKSCLINLRHVESYNRQEALLDNGERVPIAKRRYEEFCREVLTSMKRSGGIL